MMTDRILKTLKGSRKKTQNNSLSVILLRTHVERFGFCLHPLPGSFRSSLYCFKSQPPSHPESVYKSRWPGPFHFCLLALCIAPYIFSPNALRPIFPPATFRPFATGEGSDKTTLSQLSSLYWSNCSSHPGWLVLSKRKELEEDILKSRQKDIGPCHGNLLHLNTDTVTVVFLTFSSHLRHFLTFCLLCFSLSFLFCIFALFLFGLGLVYFVFPRSTRYSSCIFQTFSFISLYLLRVR